MTYLLSYLASFTYWGLNYQLEDSNQHFSWVCLAFSSLALDLMTEECAAVGSITIYFI